MSGLKKIGTICGSVAAFSALILILFGYAMLHIWWDNNVEPLLPW